MRLAVSVDQHFQRSPDGAVWTDSLNPYQFWTRYHAAFDEVLVVARCRPCAAPEPRWRRVDGPGVTVAELPWYRGPGGMLRRFPALAAALHRQLAGCGMALARVPSQLGGAMALAAARRGIPTAVEVVGDPWDMYAPGAYRGRFQPLLRLASAGLMAAQCRLAAGAAYVTASALQRRYPAASGRPQAAYICSEFADADFVAAPRTWAPGPRRWRILHVGMMYQLYKAPDAVIRGCAAAIGRGVDLELEIVGDGDFRPAMQRLAADLGLGERVRFLGMLPAGGAVRERLDAADLFLLPSYQEGLPRAMIEAMARGLPCIGSHVGGIPELIGPEARVPAADVPALAALLVSALADPVWMATQSARNLVAARRYAAAAVIPARERFYAALRRVAEARR